MANKIDPHHLVLIMHGKYGSRRQDGALRRLITTDHILEHGIGDDYDTNIQTFRILDAFSSLSVCKPKSQVVAFASQPDPAKKETTLTIAENKNVQDGLDTYVREIWEGLRKLSIMYASSRPEGLDKNGRMLEVPGEIGLPLKVEIYRTISRHTLLKQLKRVEALRDPLREFMDEVLAYRGDTYPQDFDEELLTLSHGVDKTARDPRDPHNGRDPTDEEREFIPLTSIAANDQAAIVLTAGDHDGCEKIAEKLNLSKEHPAERPFPLRHTIEKLISQSGHINNLFEFANSPSLSPALQNNLIISTVTKQTRSAELPKSPGEWELILNSANLGDPGSRRTAAEELAGYKTKRCPVHSECKLVQHFSTGPGNQGDLIPPFNYLGVSKLSCSACRVWLEAFNELGGQQFYTRGSHGAWYWPWGMPAVEASLDEVMVEKVCGAYFEHQDLDARTESAVASMTHGRPARLTTGQRLSVFPGWVARKIEVYRGYTHSLEPPGAIGLFVRVANVGLVGYPGGGGVGPRL
ncbi:hypothetical protein HOY80DRAFT_1136096 [Tuber brumale]|nr:hypothetical protein HOY80DRAFT_1136096 [Tuber brumale]